LILGGEKRRGVQQEVESEGEVLLAFESTRRGIEFKDSGAGLGDE